MFGLHNSSTLFPDNIDSRTFFSDVQLQHASIHDGYNELIGSGDYQGASAYLYQKVEQGNVNMDYNGSYLWNRFDNRIRAIEDYIVAEEDSPMKVYYSEEEPEETQPYMTWIVKP